MEPYRVYVDEIVYRIYMDGAVDELNIEVKKELMRVLFADVKIGKIYRPLEIALSMTSASLLRVYKGDEKKLLLPTKT